MLPEPFRVEQVGDSDPMHSSHLVAVAGTNSTPGRSQVIGRRSRLFGEPFLFQVIRQDHVSSVADTQPVAELNSLRRKRFDLLEKCRGVDDHAVADYTVYARAKNARGHQRELVRASLMDDGMPGIGSSLISHDDVMLVAKQVNNLPL